MDDDPDFYDTAYWHPEPTPDGLEDDVAKTTYGFPTVPGLLDAARAPFEAEGLAMPWYTAHGNHDGLIQGNLVPRDKDRALAIGDRLQTSPGQSADEFRQVTADPDRRIISTQEWVDAHFTDTAVPAGHGFTAANRATGTAYYRFDRGGVRFVVLDTCDPGGRDNGSIDPAQFAWLAKTLKASARKPVVLASHHTLSTMDNANPANDQPRVTGDAILDLLLDHECVIAWVNGHTHRNQIWSHHAKGRRGRFWEINTASHIDWPQQSRLIEIANNKDGTLSIFTTMLDHAGPASFGGDLTDPVQLAALGRELAANDWQERTTDRRGKLDARNVELVLKAPSFLR